MVISEPSSVYGKTLYKMALITFGSIRLDHEKLDLTDLRMPHVSMQRKSGQLNSVLILVGVT